MPHSRRFREIKARALPAAAALTAIFALGGGTALPGLAASPAPSPADTRSPHPVRIDVTKIQPKSLLPKHAEHAQYMVDINKLGQVTRVRPERSSDSPTFNSQTYGNALQAFIRTPDGHVVLGTYRLTYDFDPKTARVRRDVTLVRQGGVDPDAKGAAAQLMDRAHAQPISPNFAPDLSAPVDPRSLPDLKGVIEPTAPPSPH